MPSSEVARSISTTLVRWAKAFRRRARPVLVPIWYGCIAIALAWYLYRDWAKILGALQALQGWRVGACVLLLLVGKLLVGESAYFSFVSSGSRIPFREVFYIYIVTDIAKYLPGGVWAVVGRLSAYGALAERVTSTSIAFLLENVWLVLSSILLGVVFCLPGWMAFEAHRIPLAGLGVGPLVTATFVVWLGSLWLVTSALTKRRMAPALLLRVGASQIAIAVVLGLSVWVLLEEPVSAMMVLLFIGAFAIARAAGYLTFFAPAGIGVRELVFTFTLGPVLSYDKLLFVSASYRLLTLLAEAALFLAVRALRMRARALLVTTPTEVTT